jgi:hypothetical protein
MKWPGVIDGQGGSQRDPRYYSLPVRAFGCSLFLSPPFIEELPDHERMIFWDPCALCSNHGIPLSEHSVASTLTVCHETDFSLVLLNLNNLRVTARVACKVSSVEMKPALQVPGTFDHVRSVEQI